MLHWVCLLLPGLIAPSPRTEPDPQIFAAIRSIRAIDNHAHPVRVARPGERPDDEYDALPTDAMQPFDLPTRIRPENPLYIQAWHELYGYPYHDASPAHLKDVLARKARMARSKGDGYPGWVLDRLGIQTMISNRVVMGHSLGTPRFRWVPFDDALLFPLDNGVAKRRNPEYKSMYGGEELLLKRYLRELGVARLPETLDGYLNEVVAATLARQRRGGALAIKFEAAYLRKLDFAIASKSDAEQVYAQFVRGGEPGGGGIQDAPGLSLSRDRGRGRPVGDGSPLPHRSGGGRLLRLDGRRPSQFGARIRRPGPAQDQVRSAARRLAVREVDGVPSIQAKRLCRLLLPVVLAQPRDA
ncbi:amidohydrolase 2 [Fimbriimonas ginsengisoli Gsoil 348]|uniref:Amidohydrolase 2 n=1 Tax=Fimbriimonas ginsengisoli Gsoil 348 TaxID=661478 RepID=A0A068NSS0_FIMGI|nr:amidohydrolase 2 [Fimbriimonas ginsengisoli Gsoil 348]